MGMDRLTLLDIAKQQDPNGTHAMVYEILNLLNPMIQDAPAMPSNAQMGNRVTVRAGLPTVAFSKVNKGITRSKAVTKQLVDTIGMMVGLSEVDAKLLPIVGSENFQAARLSEDRAFLEAMAVKAENTMFYGNEDVDESGFTGLQPRLNTFNQAVTDSQVIAHHGSPTGDDYTSIYMVDWGEGGAHVIYPKMGTAGLMMDDMGKHRVDDADGNPMTAWVMEYTWLLGLTVKDPRRIGRLCNIDVSQALADTSTLINDSLVKLTNRMPSRNGMNRVMYCSRNIATAMELQLSKQSNLFLTWEEYLGEKTLTFKGIPVRVSDQISEAESLVS